MEKMIRSDFNQHEARIIIWESSEDLGKLLKEISENETLLAYSLLKSEKRQREFLTARIILKNVFGREVIVSYDETGKPLLAGEHCNISISHSGKYVAVMLHPEKAVGIDIECPSDKLLKLCKRFMCEQELVDFSEKKDLTYLSIIWSAKESLYKIIGKAAVDFAGQLQILPFEAAGEGEIEAIHIPGGKKFRLWYSVTDSYALTYCIDN